MKAVLVILLIVLALLQVRLWTGPGSVADIVRLEGRIEKQDEENSQLAARNSGLMDEVSDLRNGLDSIEERARNELGMIRHGETFYLIVDEEPAERGPDAPVELETPRPAPELIVAEPASEAVPEENPYLEMFREDGDAPVQARAESTPAAGQ